MVTIKLTREEYTVLPENSETLSPETLDAFNRTKLRLERILWEPIGDIDSQDGRKRFNYTILKVALLRIFDSLNSSENIPQSVANTVRKILSKIQATYEFQSPEEALSFRFPNGLNLIESLYECGYFDLEDISMNLVDSEGKQYINSPRKNVESLQNIANAIGLPKTPEKRKAALRIAWCLNRVVEVDGSPSKDCRFAVPQFLKSILKDGEIDPNERIGSYGETVFYLIGKYMVDPRNFKAMDVACKLYRNIFSEYDADWGGSFQSIRTIDPNIPDRGGVFLQTAVRSRRDQLLSSVFPADMLKKPYHRTVALIRDVENERNMFLDAFDPEPPSVSRNRGKLESKYRAHV